MPRRLRLANGPRHRCSIRSGAACISQVINNFMSPKELAAEMHITTDNLYNIKRRAMMQLMQVALNDIRAYGKK